MAEDVVATATSQPLRWRWALVAIAAGLSAAATAVQAAPRIDYRAALLANAFNIVTDIAVDDENGVWVVGTTTNHALPITAGAVDARFDAGDSQEGFVFRFDAAGDLVYASYLGGGNVDDLAAVAIDDDGNVYLAGTTYSDDFPVTAGAFQPLLASAGAEDAFLVKLDRNGQLLASTYFGGTCRDLYPGGSRGNPGVDVALGPEGALYLAGGTCSSDLPTADGQQRVYGGGTQDAFLARFDRALGFVRATYLGGANNEGAYRVAVAGNGDVFLLGVVTRIFGQPWSFPATPGTLLDDPPSEPYQFVARFDGAGALVYATFLGPAGGDGALGQYQGDLAVDANGAAYVVGVTQSPNWPTTPGALQPTLNGFSDLVVSRLAPDASALTWSTYFGGSGPESANDAAGVRIAAHADGLFIAGQSDSSDLPLQEPFETTRSRGFVAKLGLDGGLAYSSYVLPQPFGANALVPGRNPSGPPGPAPYIDVYVAGATAPLNGGVMDGVAVLGISAVDGGGGDCFGDCDGDGTVAINELIVGVNIALGLLAAGGCPNFDPDGDGMVSIADLIRAVAGVLTPSCPVP
jgi:hypothetical protein